MRLEALCVASRPVFPHASSLTPPACFRNVRLGADSASKADGQCSNHCVPAFKQAFDRCSSGGAVRSADMQLVHRVPCTGSESDID